MPSDYLTTENFLIFLVSSDSLGKAIGKRAVNIEKLGQLFKRRVIIIADSDDPEGFVRSFFSNIKIHEIEIRDIMGEKNIMLTVDEKDRGIAIGRNGERIKAAKVFLKKKFSATVHVRTKRSERGHGIEVGHGVEIVETKSLEEGAKESEKKEESAAEEKKESEKTKKEKSGSESKGEEKKEEKTEEAKTEEKKETEGKEEETPSST